LYGTGAPPEIRTKKSAQKGTATILVADDYDALRETTCEMLLSLGYEVICATDGEEAIELFQKSADQIDLVLLDLVLPSHSGPDVFSQISSIRPGTKARVRQRKRAAACATALVDRASGLAGKA
jgi:CheY-like chemotaxis protein